MVEHALTLFITSLNSPEKKKTANSEDSDMPRQKLAYASLSHVFPEMCPKKRIILNNNNDNNK